MALSGDGARPVGSAGGSGDGNCPLFPPGSVARQRADPDRASKGRFGVGIGVGGGYQSDFDACEVPIAERGSRTDEAIELLRKFWTAEPVTHSGRHHRYDNVRIHPRPMQDGGPPIIVTGRKPVAMRRAAGAFEQSLEPATLAAIGALLAVVAAAIRLGWFLPQAANASPRLDRAMMIVTSLAVVSLGGGLCLPETPVLGTFLLCTLLMAEESWAWAWHLRHCSEPTFPAVPRSVRLDTAHDSLPRTNRGAASHATPTIAPETAVLSDDITQQLTRSQAADGVEELSGWLRLSFAAGQRTGSVHVAFCPPFAVVPELEVEQIDGPEARIKPAQLLPYGTRLDLKLAAASEEPTSVLLQFSARTTREKG